MAGDYTPIEVKIDGNTPSPIENVSIADDGTVTAIYKNGAKRAIYQIALADVPSPDNLLVMTGNVFSRAQNPATSNSALPVAAALAR